MNCVHLIIPRELILYLIYLCSGQVLFAGPEPTGCGRIGLRDHRPLEDIQRKGNVGSLKMIIKVCSNVNRWRRLGLWLRMFWVLYVKTFSIYTTRDVQCVVFAFMKRKWYSFLFRVIQMVECINNHEFITKVFLCWILNC